MKILLSCCAGMSTSMLVEKMRQVAKAHGQDHTIWACSIDEVPNNLSKCDVILLGPQVRLEFENVVQIAKGKPVALIEPSDYGRLDGERVIATAEKLVSKQ